MSVKVFLPQALQGLTKGKLETEVNSGTVNDIINELEEKYPGLKERISDNGKLRRFINVYVNNEDIRFIDGEATQVSDGDEVSIVPAVAGG